MCHYGLKLKNIIMDKSAIRTVRKFQGINEILREINFVNSRSTKTAVFAILGAANFVHLINFSLQKVQKLIKIKIQTSKSVKEADFALLKSPKLISRKI